MKSSSPARLWLEYAAVRALAGTLRRLPLSLAVATGHMLGGAFYRLDRRHRNQCREAMAAALDRDREEADSLTRRMYRHFGTMLAEFPRLPLLTRDTLAQHVDFQDVDRRLDALCADGRGLIVVTGHIGNWEALGILLGLRGWTRGAIARPLDNPHLNRWVDSIRTVHGAAIWQKRGALRPALRAVHSGSGFGILMDQDGGKDGHFNHFFGRLCSTVPTVADIALRTEAVLVPLALHRTAPMQFRLDAGALFRANRAAPAREERERLLQRCNDELEALIRLVPEQWMWLHRRWKTKPKATAAGEKNP